MRSKLPLLPLLSVLCGCGLPFNPAGQPALAETAPIPQVMMGALQEDLGIGEVQAAAILGNLAQETGNFTMLQQVGGPSFGYSQWLGSRKRAFFAFAEENGGRHSFEANYGFLLHEIETEYAAMVERLRGTNDLQVASRIFMREFLRPSPSHANLPARVRYAELYLAEEFDGAGCVGEDHVVGDRIRPCPEPDSQVTVLAEATPDPAFEATRVILADPETTTPDGSVALTSGPARDRSVPEALSAEVPEPEARLLRFASRWVRSVAKRDM